MSKTTYVTERTTVVTRNAKPDRTSIDGERLVWAENRYVVADSPAAHAAAKAEPPAPINSGWGDQHDWTMHAEAAPDCDCWDVTLRCSPAFFHALLELRHSR